MQPNVTHKVMKKKARKEKKTPCGIMPAHAADVIYLVELKLVMLLHRISPNPFPRSKINYCSNSFIQEIKTATSFTSNDAICLRVS